MQNCNFFDIVFIKLIIIIILASIKMFLIITFELFTAAYSAEFN